MDNKPIHPPHSSKSNHPPPPNAATPPPTFPSAKSLKSKSTLRLPNLHSLSSRKIKSPKSVTQIVSPDQRISLLTSATTQCLNSFPLSSKDFFVLQQSIGSLQTNIQSILDDPSIPSNKKSLLNDLKLKLDSKLQDSEAIYNRGLALSPENLKYALNLYKKTAELTIDSAPTSLNLSPNEFNFYKNVLLRELNTTYDQTLNLISQHGQPLSVDQARTLFLDFKKQLISNIHAFFSQELSKSHISKIFEYAYVSTLNTSPSWDCIPRSFDWHSSTNASCTSFLSTLTPARLINPSISETYRSHNIQGISSLTRNEPNHSVNLWSSSTSVLPPDASSHLPLFSGIRHGVLSANAIHDPSSRKKANQKRASETLLALLANRISSDPHFKQTLLDSNPNDPVHFNVSSLSLLTPSSLRELIGNLHQKNNLIYQDDENRMLKEQLEAWNSLSHSPQKFTLSIDGSPRTVTIQPNFLCFNFGSNPEAVKTIGPAHIPSQLIGGWNTSDKLNKKSLLQLLGTLSPNKPLSGLVQNSLSTLPENDPKRPIITQLAHQIIQIWNDNSYKSMGNDAYKMSSRILLLSYLIGLNVAYNCKSGKDRTGQLDIEIKFLATQIHLNGSVPLPNQPLSDSEITLYRNVMFQSGNDELQKIATGFIGSRADLGNNLDSDSTAKRLGSWSARIYSKGASRVPDR